MTKEMKYSLAEKSRSANARAWTGWDGLSAVERNSLMETCVFNGHVGPVLDAWCDALEV